VVEVILEIVMAMKKLARIAKATKKLTMKNGAPSAMVREKNQYLVKIVMEQEKSILRTDNTNKRL
jgi:hypothetical protein